MVKPDTMISKAVIPVGHALSTSMKSRTGEDKKPVGMNGYSKMLKRKANLRQHFRSGTL